MKAQARQLTHGSLFAGIGGFDLGFERAGIKTVWQVEIDPFCRKVLEKHWPNVRRHDDIRTMEFGEFEQPTVVTGGFPCQDTSLAGKRAGLSGAQSSLWFQMHQAICAIRPLFVVVENVPGLRSAGLGEVLGGLAHLGYDCEWECIPAFAFGAEHIRERIFIVAYLNSARSQVWRNERKNLANEGIFGAGIGFAIGAETTGLERRGAARWSGDVHGIPQRVDRIKSLGNAVVPQIAQWIGERIKAVIEV